MKKERLKVLYTFYASKKNRILLLLLLLTHVFIQPTHGQHPVLTLSVSEKNQVIDSVSKILLKMYVYPETGKKMAAQLQINKQQGLYNTLTEPKIFAERLFKDLFAICHDKHFALRYDPVWVQKSKIVKTEKQKEEQQQNQLSFAKSKNFGFREIRILDGNLGYLDLRDFSDPRLAKTTTTAAMNFLNHTNALIIDLRNNGGGFPEMVQLLASYFFEGESKPLNDIYWRPTDELSHMRTLDTLEGKRMPQIPLYVLTSKKTFSAAEDFCYSLKNLQRITLIGETTGGGAHPVMPLVACGDFMIYVPVGRSISPFTKTDWEGTGVKPDLEKPEKQALDAARLLALEKLAFKEPDNTQFSWALASLKAQLRPESFSPTELKSYTGQYGDNKIVMNNAKLYLQRPNRQPEVLLPVEKDVFHIAGMTYFQINILREQGKITAMKRLYDDHQIFIDKLIP